MGMEKNNNKKYKYKTGQVINTKNGKIKILDQIIIKNNKGYKYKCLIDNNIDQITEHKLNQGKGCIVCTKQKVLVGYNDIWTTNPKLASLLANPDDGYKYSQFSGKRVDWICPKCKFILKNRIIKDISYYGFSCPRCSDGISYPNKFVRSFFDQVNEKYIPEYSPKWAARKRYDIYLPNRNEIWEIHGLQHYKEGGFNQKKAKTLSEQQKNDKVKKELAERNGCKYFVVDAQKSQLEYIRNNILKLSIVNRYNLSEVDWNKCHKYGCNSLVKVVCNLWNNGIRNVSEIGKIVKISNPTTRKYLKQGAKLNWCDYDAEENANLIRSKNGKLGKRSVVQLDLNYKFIKNWDSIVEAENFLGINNSGITGCCKKKLGSFGGFIWMYEEDYEKNKNNLINLKPYKRKRVDKKRPVVQLTFNNEFIKEYDGIIDAHNELNICNSSIVMCCKGKINYAGGFKWAYKKDYEQNKYNHEKIIFLNVKKKVVQLTLTNELINIYESIAEAGRKTNISSKNISACCCRNKHKTAGGFKWMYAKDYEKIGLQK